MVIHIFYICGMVVTVCYAFKCYLFFLLVCVSIMLCTLFHVDIFALHVCMSLNTCDTCMGSWLYVPVYVSHIVCLRKFHNCIYYMNIKHFDGFSHDVGDPPSTYIFYCNQTQSMHVYSDIYVGFCVYLDHIEKLIFGHTLGKSIWPLCEDLHGSCSFQAWQKFYCICHM